MARNNGAAAERAEQAASEQLNKDITQFWALFAKDGEVPEEAPPIVVSLAREHCPLLRLGWDEVSGEVRGTLRRQMGLFRAYTYTQGALRKLHSKPRWPIWIVTSVMVMAAVPLLWGLALASQGASGATVPWMSLGVWFALFVAMLQAPAVLLAGEDRDVNDGLRRLDQAARALLGRIEQTMRSVARYGGTIQRNFVIGRLREKLAQLSRDAAQANAYMTATRTSLGTPVGPRDGIGPRAPEGMVEAIRTSERVEDWLDAALQSFRLEPEMQIRAHARGGEELRLLSSWVRTPSLIVRLERVVR
jgi:hypothetical protein